MLKKKKDIKSIISRQSLFITFNTCIRQFCILRHSCIQLFARNKSWHFIATYAEKYDIRASFNLRSRMSSLPIYRMPFALSSILSSTYIVQLRLTGRIYAIRSITSRRNNRHGIFTFLLFSIMSAEADNLYAPCERRFVATVCNIIILTLSLVTH